MFLIDAIKHKHRKEIQNFFFFLRDCLREVTRLLATVQNKTSFVSFRLMSSGGFKHFIQKKRESLLTQIFWQKNLTISFYVKF